MEIDGRLVFTLWRRVREASGSAGNDLYLDLGGGIRGSSVYEDTTNYTVAFV